MTGSLRDRLDSKARRRIVVPVQLADPGDDARRALEQGEMRLMGLRALNADPDAVQVAEEEIEAARVALAVHEVDVELVALDRDDWEALTGPHRLDDGDYDWQAVLAPALAACAVDESLQDEQWWAERVNRWSYGEVTALRRAVLQVNAWAPQPYIPKD